MPIWGGLVDRPGGGRIFQIYVDVDSVRELLREPADRDYNQYLGDEAELDLGTAGTPDEVWLCVVREDADGSRPLRP